MVIKLAWRLLPALLFFSMGMAQKSVDVSTLNKPYTVKLHYYSGAEIGTPDHVSEIDTAAFKPYTQKAVSGVSYWSKLDIVPEKEIALKYIEFHFPLVNSMLVYVPMYDGSYKCYSKGTSYPVEKVGNMYETSILLIDVTSVDFSRPFFFKNTPLFILGVYSLSREAYITGYNTLPKTAYSQYRQRQVFQDKNYYGFFTMWGVLIISFLFVFIFYGVLRKSFLLYYALYLLSLITVYSILIPNFYNLYAAYHPYLYLYVLLNGGLLANFFYMLFVKQFVGMKQNYPGVNRLYKILLYAHIPFVIIVNSIMLQDIYYPGFNYVFSILLYSLVAINIAAIVYMFIKQKLVHTIIVFIGNMLVLISLFFIIIFPSLSVMYIIAIESLLFMGVISYLDKKNVVKAAERDKLKQIDDFKNRFFADISHELRTPLTLISGHLQAILREKYGAIGQQLRDNLEVSQSNSRRLLNMTEEILDLSKMEAGKLELHNKPLKLHSLISRLCNIFESYLEEKQINFHQHIAIAPDLTVLLDEKKFQKIVINLLSNAAKFTGAGGSISVGIKEMIGYKDKENQLQLTVRDNGKGIHPDDLPYIFDRFYQRSHSKDTPIEGGTGIGLALAKQLAELFGGSLQAESQLGKGSAFTFIFPKKEAVALPEETGVAETEDLMTPDFSPEKQENGPEAAQGDSTPLLLIVEDHPEMRSFIRQQVGENYRILEAGDGVEALEVLKKQRPDLILSDVMMPRMDGFQLLQELRTDPATENIPVIMLTARAARKDRLRALTIGVDDYLTKPFDEEELTARIRYSLRNQVNRKQWSARLPEAEKETLTADVKFLRKAENVVSKALSDYGYSVIDMAEALNLSRRQLFRKIKAATGLSPLQFIREIRLQKARSLMENREKETVAEVMYAVGFQRSGYFARVYFKRFGKLPSSYFE